jgi:hypothetical protein
MPDVATPPVPHASPAALEQLSAWLARWQCRLAVLFAALLVIGSLPGVIYRLTDETGVRNPGPLQVVETAAAMVHVLACQNGSWPAPDVAVAPGKSASAAEISASAPPPPKRDCETAAPPVVANAGVKLMPVRWVLAFDSMFTVPGYTGWLLLATAWLFLHRQSPWRRARLKCKVDWREFALQLLCVLPVAAAAFDLAENGITMIAIEDAVSGILADETVRDMHLATTCKWALFAVSCGVVAVHAFAASANRARQEAAGSIPAARAPAEDMPPGVLAYAPALRATDGASADTQRDAPSWLSRHDGVLLAAGACGVGVFLLLMPVPDVQAALRTGCGMALAALEMACIAWRMSHPLDADQ